MAHYKSYIANAVDSIERGIPYFAAGKASWREAQSLCVWFRQRGVCTLLKTGTTRDFHISMMQSAAAFTHYLARCADDQKVTSQAGPFFDALCGGYFSAARRIAELSRQAWQQDLEYEDDCLYTLTLMAMLRGASVAETTSLHERMVVAAQGKEPARQKICSALLARDTKAFEAALSELLDHRAEAVRELIDKGGLPPEFAAWMRPFAHHGLGLVMLAQSCGMTPHGPYRDIPQVVCAASPLVFDEESWRDVNYTALAS